ncbi:MAG: hypothetical protein FJY07_10560, partial [Bacteroidetes bacterium]|nr:hypothetical protein [Bacteroidota bacterium]
MSEENKEIRDQENEAGISENEPTTETKFDEKTEIVDEVKENDPHQTGNTEESAEPEEAQDFPAKPEHKSKKTVNPEAEQEAEKTF